jgi:hypothetical protein
MGLVGHSQEALFYIRPKGWLRIDELQRNEVRSSQAFVAMLFNPATDEPYENGLSKAIYDSGYDPRRIDQKHHHLNRVDDEIIAEIRRSRFLVADFTCEPGSVRGGVYFETGFAMGLNIPIIWTCKETSMRELPQERLIRCVALSDAMGHFRPMCSAAINCWSRADNDEV